MKDFSVKNYRLIYRGHIDIGACYPEVDGFYVWEPGEGCGVYTENDLRRISDFLHELNAEWREFIENNL